MAVEERPYMEQVAKGIEVLDRGASVGFTYNSHVKRWEGNWRSLIDPSLDMSDPSPCGCVLGRLFGSFTTGVQVIEEFLDSHESIHIEHGFDVSRFREDGTVMHPGDAIVSRRYRQLRREWLRQLEIEVPNYSVDGYADDGSNDGV